MKPVPVAERGVIDREPRSYGQSLKGLELEIFMPERALNYLIFAGIHGHEPDTTTLLSAVLRSVPKGALSSAVILASNPDGILQGTRGNSRGVELNRNFPTRNWSNQPVRHKWLETGPQEVELSPGDYPGSEPETQALIGLIQDLKPALSIALHSPLACIDYEHSRPHPLVRWLSLETGLPLVTSVGYECPGSFASWGEEQDHPVITYELEPAGNSELLARHYKALYQVLIGACP